MIVVAICLLTVITSCIAIGVGISASSASAGFFTFAGEWIVLILLGLFRSRKKR